MIGLSLSQFRDFGPLYGPPRGGSGPAVIVLHGSEGPMAGWAHRFAAILAAHGFLALPLGYGEGSLWGAGQIREVPLGRVVAAAEALAGLTREGKVGVFGWSKGAEKALLLASLIESADTIACVAAHAPPDRVTAAFDPTKVDLTAPRVLKDSRDDPKAWSWSEDSYRLDPGAEIEIERYAGPVFLSVGTADEVWDHRMTLALAARLEDAGRPADLFVAEGQGHGFDFDTEPQLWARLTAFLRRHLQK